MSTREFALSTTREELTDITGQVRLALEESGIWDGICVVFCPHTTAAITINENADPDVIHDLLLGLRVAFPDRQGFRHLEGNSAAHLKSSAIGCSVTVIVENGKLMLGVWQSIYFCEFDGPRYRRFSVKLMGEK